MQELDYTIAIALNGGTHAFLDAWAVLLTNTVTWLPLFVCLIVMVVKNNEKPSQIALIFLSVAIGAVLSLALDNLLVKPLVARPRPFCDPALSGLVATVNGYTATGYSFFSAHASNTMALAVFVSLLVRNRTLTVAMLLWSVVNCWTRLYLGVHFASDVLVGMVWGAVVGWSIFFLFYKPLYHRISTRLHFISSQYTKMGYAYTDIDTTLCVMSLTVAVTIVIACWQAG